MIIAVLALIGGFVAVYLALFKMGYIGQLTCSIGGCERVNTSSWATFLGIPVALWGVGFYLVTFLVAFIGTLDRLVGDRRIAVLLTVLTGTGVIYSAWLTYLELFVIHAICQYCVVSAIVVTVMFVVSMLELRDKRWRNT